MDVEEEHDENYCLTAFTPPPIIHTLTKNVPAVGGAPETSTSAAAGSGAGAGAAAAGGAGAPAAGHKEEKTWCEKRLNM